MNALRAFEAAARHGSFSMAADELCVTPGAVAQHIKSLEAWTGARLFSRHAQGVHLTELGASVVTEFSEAFDRMGDAVQTLRTNAMPDHVRIAALPSVAQLWVSPKLPAIRKCMPEVTISITAEERPPNLKREPFDLSIFFGSAAMGSKLHSICKDAIFPVCAPSVAKQINSFDDLANHTLLHDLTWSDDWKLWLESVGESSSKAKSGPVFSLYSLAVEEAKNGAGLLIGHEPLVQYHIAKGDLIAPFDHRLVLDQQLLISSARKIKPSSNLERIIHLLGS